MPNEDGLAMSEKADVIQGTLDLMVLQMLDTIGPQHGYGIAARLEQDGRHHSGPSARQSGLKALREGGSDDAHAS